MGLDITGLGSIFDFGSKLLDKFVVDKGAAAQAKAELLQALQQGDLAQLQVNANEASNPSVFVAGWRPGMGWTCVAGYAIAFVIMPIFTFIVHLIGTPVAGWGTVAGPAIGIGELSPILLGMLGLGGLRTFEKIKGVSR